MTMTSMFSSFEAFSFESSFGQKMRSLVGPPRSQPEGNKPTGTGEGGTTSPAGDTTGRGSSPPPQQQKKRLRPRFAPELDGLNCFETIIPY